jgi:predicted DNA-binding transcriptional regulator AlpA
MSADRLVREPERRSLTGISATTCWRLEREGKFPRRVKLTDSQEKSGRVGWWLSEVVEWMASRHRVTLKEVAEERASQ